MTANMRTKVDAGNAMSLWLSTLVLAAIAANLPFWIENPAGSFLWLQQEWASIISQYGVGSFYTDYCRWGTPWRKRTRFLGNFSAAGQKYYCCCKVPHVRLVGYSAEHRCCWTKAAESYPKNLARYLAAALAESLKPVARRRLIDPGDCAKCGRGRIGEAANPGPRLPAPRPQIDLEGIQLVRPATLALQAKVHRMYLDWLRDELSAASWTSIVQNPQLQVMFLRSYGNWLYSTGKAMYLFRHLVVFCQQQFPGEKNHVTPAWELLAKWEIIQPVTHRPPLPKVVLDAMVCLALSWGWCKWASITLLAFHGACRVGEPLQARRKDLILPAEAGLSNFICFLNIPSPKTSRRGRGKIQHTKVTDEDTVRLAIEVFGHVPPDRFLYPSSLSSYRLRWDRLLETLAVPPTAKLTPGCVRGGGAVFMYHSGQPVSNIQWTMRLKNLATLESYLQETAALGVIHQLPDFARRRVFSCASMLPHVKRLYIQCSSETK